MLNRSFVLVGVGLGLLGCETFVENAPVEPKPVLCPAWVRFIDYGELVEGVLSAVYVDAEFDGDVELLRQIDELEIDITVQNEGYLRSCG